MNPRITWAHFSSSSRRLSALVSAVEGYELWPKYEFVLWTMRSSLLHSGNTSSKTTPDFG